MLRSIRRTLHLSLRLIDNGLLLLRVEVCVVRPELGLTCAGPQSLEGASSDDGADAVSAGEAEGGESGREGRGRRGRGELSAVDREELTVAHGGGREVVLGEVFAAVSGTGGEGQVEGRRANGVGTGSAGREMALFLFLGLGWCLVDLRAAKRGRG
jgi:hypothetical protein